ncbi:MAG: glycosyltransferase [Sedimentisphaerales bacterium]
MTNAKDSLSHRAPDTAYQFSAKAQRRILLATSAAPAQSPFSTKEKRPPIGIGFLISVLRNAGHKVLFIDNYLQGSRGVGSQPSDFLETDYLQEEKIDYVGIYANTICFRDTLRMLYKLQQLRQTGQWAGRIIVGGPHTTVAAHTIPDFVDYVVQGEGEQAICDIVEDKVTDRIVRYPRIKNLDELPMPAWDYFVNLPYDWGSDFFGDKPVFTMNTSRGCPFRCTFCSVGSVWGKRYTCFSAERIVSDIEYLMEHYGAKGIYFREDNFTLDEQRLRKFCHLLIENRIKVSWACESRVSNLTRDLVELMSGAGAKGFYFGVESGSQRILDFLQKGLTVEQIENAFKWCHEFNVRTAASVIVGVPGETEADCYQTNELLKKINPTVTWFNVFVGIPDSNLYRFVLNNKLYQYIDDRGLVYLPEHNNKVKHYYGGSWNAYIPDTEQNKDWTNKPKVSVLICVYNGEKFIGQALESIYSQTYQDFELIIVDDASTDNTPDILVNIRDSRTFIYRNSQNKGLTKSLNIGLKLCRGQYIARMDADDISAPQRFEKQVEFLDENPNCLAVGCWCNWIDSEGKIYGSWEPPTSYEGIKKKLLVNNSLAHGSVMLRRASLLEIGGYNEKYRYAQDYDLWLRLSEVGQIQNIPEHLYNLRSWDGAASTSQNEQQDRFAQQALQQACKRRGIAYITIVAVNFNTLDFIKLCISKVFELSDLPFEMIVVDNGSTDQSLEYLKSEKRIKLLQLPQNVGHGPALDYAMKYVATKYVVVMDSDAHPIHKEWLSRLIKPLSSEILASGIHHHRNYVHPACMAMETETFWKYNLTFKPNWPPDNDIKKLGVTHWDVGEYISMEILRRGKKLHYFERSNEPSVTVIGSEYGGIVYHHFYGTRVVTQPHRDKFDKVTRDDIIKAKNSHFSAENNYQSIKLSVVLTTYNRPQLLEKTLTGFANQTISKEVFEVIVVDDGSEPSVKGVVEKFSSRINTVYLYQQNSGLAAARNHGIKQAKGRIVLFSDDDDVPGPELIAEHLRSHQENPDERIAVLGHLDWHKDLEITPLMQYVTHVGGEYFGYDRLQDGQFYDVWKWWGGLVSAKLSLLRSVEGPFDSRLRFGYEDTELACRLLDSGVKVLYNARAKSFILRAVDFEGFCQRRYRQGQALYHVASAHPEIIIPRYKLQNANELYYSKYAAFLDEWTSKVIRFEQLLNSESHLQRPDIHKYLKSLYVVYHECFVGYWLKGYVEQMQTADAVTKLPNFDCRLPIENRKSQIANRKSGALRITFISTNTPGFDIGSSNLRIYYILKILVNKGHKIDYLYFSRYDHDSRYKAAFDSAVNFIQAQPTVSDFNDYLRFHKVEELDYVWITNLWSVDYLDLAAQLTRWLKYHHPQTKVIIDTMDFHYKKLMRKFDVSQDNRDLLKAEQFLEVERQLYPLADKVVTVTEIERRDILESIANISEVSIIPNIHRPLPQTPPLQQRKHICFIGGFHVSHNVDAVKWFLKEVFPIIVEKAPAVEFHILGFGNEKFKNGLEVSANIKVIGYVEDAESAVANYRVFVCPMTYGAGMKGKLGTAAASGTPIVTTTVGAEGFDFVDGRSCFIADEAGDFAQKCLWLLSEDSLWNQFSIKAKEEIAEKFSIKAVSQKIDALLSRTNCPARCGNHLCDRRNSHSRAIGAG